MIHRCIIISENGKEIIRNDKNINGYDNLEKEIYDFLTVLEAKSMINSKKLMNMLKIKNNDVGLLTIPEIIIKPKNWMINEITKNTLEVK